MAKKRYYESKYGGLDARKEQEEKDAMMISGTRGIANMPQSVIYAEYPKAPNGTVEGINDTMNGIDTQIEADLVGKKPPAESKF